MTDEPSTVAPLTADERDDFAAGDHYEREASPPTCICGEEWICPKWVEAVVAQQEADYKRMHGDPEWWHQE